jgi:alpha-tubulin suppressor-like RCC1 family protein
LGLGFFGNYFYVPQKINFYCNINFLYYNIVKIKKIQGFDFSILLTEDGKLFSFGDNNFGQLVNYLVKFRDLEIWIILISLQILNF